MRQYTRSRGRRPVTVRSSGRDIKTRSAPTSATQKEQRSVPTSAAQQLDLAYIQHSIQSICYLGQNSGSEHGLQRVFLHVPKSLRGPQNPKVWACYQEIRWKRSLGWAIYKAWVVIVKAGWLDHSGLTSPEPACWKNFPQSALQLKRHNTIAYGVCGEHCTDKGKWSY